jgi:hypothetical protein
MFQAHTLIDNSSRLEAKKPATFTNLTVHYPHVIQPDGSVVNMVDDADRNSLQVCNLQVYMPAQVLVKDIQRPRGNHSTHSPIYRLVESTQSQQQHMQKKIDSLLGTFGDLDDETNRDLFNTIRFETNYVLDINTGFELPKNTRSIELDDVSEVLMRSIRRFLWYFIADPLPTFYRDGDAWADNFKVMSQHLLGLVGRLRDAAALHLISNQQRRRKLLPVVESLEHLFFGTSNLRVCNII